MDKRYANITWETPDTVIEGTPVRDIPYEIKDYYAKYGYWKRNISFSTKTVKQIAKILESGEVPKEDMESYDENMTFEMLTSFPRERTFGSKKEVFGK